MSEELLQTKPFRIGRYVYYRLGSTTLNQLKKAKIISRVEKKLGDKKPDGLILLPGGAVKAIIEYKQPSELSTTKQIEKAIKQELEVARSLCKLLIVTDGTKSFWINATNGERITKKGKEIEIIFDAGRLVANGYSIEEKIDLETFIDEADFSLSELENELLEPEILDPTPLAKEVWQKIWINTGKEPEKCLYNVVEIFVFKFLSDIGVLDSFSNFGSVYERREKTGNIEALKYYADVCRKKIKNDMFPKGEDGTTIFNGTIFVNETGSANTSQAELFGNVLESFQKYDEQNGSFRYVTKEFKTRLYETFLRQSAGVKNLGQYFTPRNVVQAMVKMSSAKSLKQGSRICDPFCGVGGFVLEAIVQNDNIFREFEPKNGIISPNIVVRGYDKGTDEKDDERTIILAKANMLIYFSDLLAKYHTQSHLNSFSHNAFNNVFHLLKSNLGTFNKIEDEKYDLILTNPPYVTNSSANIKQAATSIFDVEGKPYYTLKGRGVETLAIEWVIKNLADGGEAWVVVPDGLLTQKTVLDYIKTECIVNAVVSLPKNTFYATPKKTYIIGLTKKSKKEIQKNDVFTFVVSEIGETRDTKRFVKDQQGKLIRNDLTDCVQQYILFKSGVDNGSSERTKVINFSEFNAFSDWLVEKKLTDEQKIKIGLLKAKKVVDEKQFISNLSEIGEYLDKIVDDKLPAISRKAETLEFPMKKFFDFPTIKGVTEKFIRNHSGEIPVYGGRQFEEPVGKIGDKIVGIKYFENCLAWNREGSVGYVFYHDHKFTTNDHHRPMVLKDEYEDKISLRYVRLMLQKTLLSSDSFEWSKTASKEKVQVIKIPYPVDKRGEPDFIAQEEIANRMESYDSIIEELTSKIEMVRESSLDIFS